MTKKEITKTQEVVVRTLFVAEDGREFNSEEECKKYEESAKFALLSELKLLKRCTQYDIDDDKSDEDDVEIFDIQTEHDLELLRRYLVLELRENRASEADIDCMFNNETYGFNHKTTIGHEIIVNWNYNHDGFWTYGDGSIEAYLNHYRENLEKLIAPKED